MKSPVDLETRISRLEIGVRIATVAAVLGIAIGLLGTMAGFGNGADAAQSRPRDAAIDHLRVRQLDIVDAKGTTRVKLAAPLPNAVRNGKTVTRGGRPVDTVSGILLYDATGGERSGYATSDRGYSNVIFTLDEPGGEQHALFIAEQNGSATLRLFNADTQDRADLSIGEDGPAIVLVHRGVEVFRQPSK